MAKFRMNHQRGARSAAGGLIVKVGLFAFVFGALFLAFRFLGGVGEEGAGVLPDVPNLEERALEEIYYLPTSTTGQIVRHKYYALSYHERYELPEWVAYELTRSRLRRPFVKRTKDYRPDPSIATGSAQLEDFRGSGYDRGHLVPAADMAFSEEAMSETFYLSNMCPQARGFNQGIWRELEENTRYWARKFGHLYVVSGPVLTQPVKFWLGDNEVAVPSAFFKVLLDLTEPELKGIAWVIPNSTQAKPLDHFAVSINAVEKLTGLDFFPQLMEDSLEERLESTYDPALWPLSEKKYRLRVEKWNKVR